MTTTAYIRMSTPDQDVQKNRHEILEFVNARGLGQIEFVDEHASGRVHWQQRKIGAVLERLGAGDTLIVPELSRLGRSTLETMEMLSIASRKRIAVYSLKERWTLDGSIQSEIMAAVFAIVARMERDYISMRTKEALAAKRASGVRLGRPTGTGKSKLDADRAQIERMIGEGVKLKRIAARFGTSESNLRRWLRAHEIKA